MDLGEEDENDGDDEDVVGEHDDSGEDTEDEVVYVKQSNGREKRVSDWCATVTFPEIILRPVIRCVVRRVV